MKGKQMPHYFWGEAVITSMYILNRSPTKKLQGCTPEKARSGHKPSVSHFKIFGSLCFKHVLEQLRRKLDDRAKSMVLIGYHPTGAYKLYNPKMKKVLVNRDVLIDESKSWDWTTTTTDNTKRNVIMHFDNADIEVKIVESTNIQLRRSHRERQAPQALRDYEVYFDTTINAEGELVHFSLLAESKLVSQEEFSRSTCWRYAMEEELKSIEKNDTWELVDLPKRKRPIDVKWVYKTKMKPNGVMSRYKVRHVVRGFL